MNICNCGKPISEKSNNQKMCASCVGKRGGRKPVQKEKLAKMMKTNTGLPTGYYYYTRSMLTPDEKLLFPGNQRNILVHRLVMAKYLNRPLERGEVVMHVDGDKLNNRIDNLMLGDSLTNSRQHWDARVEMEQWKRLSTMLAIIANKKG